MLTTQLPKYTSASMDPWWAILRAHRVRTAIESDTNEVRGLDISLVPFDTDADQPNALGRCRALRDALELVFLQSIVDHRAFVKALLDQESDGRLHDSIKDELLRGDGPFPCHAHVGIFYSRSELQTKRWVKNGRASLLSPRQQHEGDQPFQDQRARLFAIPGASGACKSLKISMHMASDSSFSSLKDFVMADPLPPRENPFCRVMLGFHVAMEDNSEEEIADITAHLNDKHKRVRLSIALVDGFDEAKSVAYGHLLGACFQPEGLTELPAFEPEEENARAAVSICACARQRPLTQLCSAVMAARGVEALTLNWIGFPWQLCRYFYTRWFMLSLFSNVAQHSITKLELNNFFMNDADMDDLETFVSSKNRLLLLQRQLHRWNDEDGDVDDVPACRDQIFLEQGTKLWLNALPHINKATEQSETAIVERGCWADVVGDGPSCYDVLVPAFGWCKVNRSEKQARRFSTISEAIDGSGGVAGHRITSLALKWQSQHSQRFSNSGFHRFLTLIGAPLQRLELHHARGFPVESIWSACPLLRHLELWKVDYDVLGRITDAYECGKCHVTSLALYELNSPRQSQQVVEFCEQLCDPEKRISNVLTELGLGSEHRHVTKEELTSMLKMLDLNQKLRSFSVYGRAGDCDWFVDRLKTHNSVVLPHQGVPLSRRAKLAFLSTETATRGDGPHRGIGQLDSDVARLIFEMAAAPVKRCVNLVW